MKTSRKVWLVATPIVLLFIAGYLTATHLNSNPRRSIGQELDALNGVPVFYNGPVGNTTGRSISRDGYNLGLKYQCVEFVKRYYYERFGHKMPDPYGHAREFFDGKLRDGEWNRNRALLQFANGSEAEPAPDDILVLGPSTFNEYGHVAIISKVSDREVEIVQQNPGPFESSRAQFSMHFRYGKWFIENDRVLGWLRIRRD